MLKRLYANNYRCLVNFELEFSELTLLLGPNGGGKTTIFDVLFGIRRLIVDNARIGDVFKSEDTTAWVNKSEDTTAWVNKNEQSFELDVQGEDGLYSYRLVIAHNPDFKKQYIELERLLFDGEPLFECRQGEITFYRSDQRPLLPFSLDMAFSALATIEPRTDNTKLIWFKQWIEKLCLVCLHPRSMLSEATAELEWFDRDGVNFASWYRFFSQEHQDIAFTLTQQLRETIPGFHAFRLEQAGKSRILKVGFVNDDQKGSPIFLDFGQLSDGQRVLIVLYSLLIGVQHLGLTVFLDEPENYLALQEIQPWLMELRDVCEEGIPQAVLISHHPELIDYLGPDCGQWIERDPLGPARVKVMPARIDPGLTLSEQVARGWTE